MSLSNRSLYRIIAGAPGASGSSVIFNSSGLTGGQSAARDETQKATETTTEQMIANRSAGVMGDLRGNA
jgi:hypothetical protein